MSDVATTAAAEDCKSGSTGSVGRACTLSVYFLLATYLFDPAEELSAVWFGVVSRSLA